MKLNIKTNTVGVYLITNVLNGKKYVGASNDVRARIHQHFTPSCYERYQNNQFYIDIKHLGKKWFKCELLEETNKDNKLEKEQYWYDLFKPEYNFVRPTENMFLNKKIIERASKNSNTPELVERRKKLYNTDEYLNIFRNCNPNMRPVDMYKDDELILSFKSIRSTARWLDKNTNYKSKNKASKVKSVCDNERKTAFGYTFKYSTKSVETIPKGSRKVIDTLSEAVNI